MHRDENYISPKGYRSSQWVCLCDCGKISTVRSCYLKSGAIKSCGCLKVDHPNRTTHGKKDTRIYYIWSAMKQRCLNPNSRNYSNYGGRGITVCEDWKYSFENFYNWSLGNGYNDNLSIDRIDNNLGYCPENCRWTDGHTQANNTRHNKMLTHNGKTRTMSEWSKETGIKYQKIKDRLNKCGWSVEQALSIQ